MHPESGRPLAGHRATHRMLTGVVGASLLTSALVASGGGAVLAQDEAACTDLNMLYATVEADVEAIKLALPLYEAETGVRIELDSQPYNALQQKVFAELGSQSPFYDIIIVDTPWMPAVTNQIEPLISYIEDETLTDPELLALDDFIPKVFYDTAVYNHPDSHLEFPGDQSVVDVQAIKDAGFDIYGLPLQANALTMSYRSDLFEDPDEQAAFEAEYGRPLAVPETWDEFVEVAQFFTRPDENLYGTTLMAGPGDWATDDFKSLLAGFGGYGKMINDQFERVFNGPEGEQALQLYQDLINEYQVTPPGVTSFSWDEASAAFVAGLTAMSMNYHSEVLSPDIEGDVAYALVPAGPDGARGPHFGTWMLSVNKFSEKKDCAWQAIQWLTSPSTQTQMLATQLHPSRFSVYEAAASDPVTAQFGNFYEVLGESLAVGVGRPRLTNYGEVDEIIWTAVNKVASGAATPAEALQEADGLVLAALQNAGYPAE
jgi:multiple sugar transport system substrate-binding protein